MSVEIRPLPLRAEQRRLYGRQGYRYRAADDLVATLNAAVVLGLPLLLTGEPGGGKTDFAFAVARYMAGNALDWDPDDAQTGLLECYVRSETQASHLLYAYDAIRRFADAHHGDAEERALARDPRNYIHLEPLGLALDQAAAGRARVVLIDEIDKAPRDLPNDLLRELDQGRFEIKEIPYHLDQEGASLRRLMGLKTRRSAELVRPLVMITTNAERQLPDAFLRRCVFHRVRFPDQAALDAILAERPGAEHQPAELRKGAVEVFLALRSVSDLHKPPSTSELINWFDALLAGQLASLGGMGRVWMFAEHLERSGEQLTKRSGTPTWDTLPGLGCLLKLDDDWRRVHGL